MTVRIMAPDGTLGRIPEEQIEAAVAAGGRVMTPDDLRAMYHAIFMEHGLFKEQHMRPVQKKRKSFIRGRR